MHKDSLKRWKAEIYESKNYNGPWEKRETVTIDIPENYKRGWYR